MAAGEKLSGVRFVYTRIALTSILPCNQSIEVIRMVYLYRICPFLRLARMHRVSKDLYNLHTGPSNHPAQL